MGLLDPRDDDRPPTFFRGQWFGTVPHSRVILIWPDATGDWAFMAGGCVVEALFYADADPNDALAGWQGFFNHDGDSYVAVYSWDCTDKGSGEAVTELSIIQDGPAGYIWQGFRTYQPLRPADRLPFEVGLPGYEQDLGTNGVKIDVPEWSDVLSRWPDAFPTTPTP